MQRKDITTAHLNFEDGSPIRDADNPAGWRGPVHALGFPFNQVSCDWCGFHAPIPSSTFPKLRYKHLGRTWVCPSCGLRIELVLRSDAAAMTDFLRVCAELLEFVECQR